MLFWPSVAIRPHKSCHQFHSRFHFSVLTTTHLRLKPTSLRLLLLPPTMGRTKISAGRMAREPSVPKLIAVETSPPTTTTTTTESTPSLPSQPDRSPSLPHANPPPEATKNSLSSSPPPPQPDTKKKANKPRPKPQLIPRRPPTLRSRKKIVPPLTRSQAKVEIPDNTLTVDGSDESESEEVASGEHNTDLSEPDSPEPEHTPPQTQEKHPEPPAVHPTPTVTDQPKSSRRRAPPEDFVLPAPKRKKAQMACGEPSLPPDNLHFPKMQLRNRHKHDDAAKNKKKTKPKQEKTLPKRRRRRKRINNC